MKSRRSILNFVLLSAGILVLLNLLATKYFFRLDFTEDKRYTLSDATINILNELKTPVTITAYFSEDLPPDITKTKRDFKDLLIEYSNRSKGKVFYEFINPTKDQQTETKAMQSGVQPVIVNVREKDQMKQQKAYLGAVVQMGEETDVIPFMQPGAAMEYALSSSIKKISIKQKPTVGILQGHGEAKLSELKQVNESLSILYNVQELTLNDTASVPAEYKTIAIIDLKDSVPVGQFKQLDAFLERGGQLFVAYSKVTGDLSKASGSSRTTNFEKWLTQKGITIENNFVIDASCGSVQVMQQQGAFNFASNINFPYMPVVNNFGDHPATKGIEAIMFQFISPVKFVGGTDTNTTFVPLLMSSKKSGTEAPPLYFNIQRRWTQNDFPMSNLILGGALTKKGSSGKKYKIILIANGNFAVNGEAIPGRQPNQLRPDNVSLLVNSIDWLSDDTGLIDLRTKGVTSRPLDQIEDSTKAILKYLNFLLPIILIVVYGFIRFQIKRTQRVKRMEESYV